MTHGARQGLGGDQAGLVGQRGCARPTRGLDDQDTTGPFCMRAF